MASKTIEIHRKKENTNLPDALLEGSVKKIGSYFDNGRIATGLSDEEVRKFMPIILGMSVQDVNFYRQVQIYFRDLSIKVPQEGIKLECGLDDSGFPVNVYDYVKYRFAKRHPYTAPSFEKAKKNDRFYMRDRTEELIKSRSELDIRTSAYTEFVKLVAEESKMNAVLKVYGEDPDRVLDKKLKIEELMNESHQHFLKITTDKDLETKAFLEDCLTYEVLRKVGNTIMDGDEVIGNTPEEAIIFLQDKKNSGVVTTIKARLRSFSVTAGNDQHIENLN